MNIIKVGSALYDVGKAVNETVQASDPILKDVEQRKVLLKANNASFGKKAFTIGETILVEGFQNWDTIKPALTDTYKAFRDLWNAFKDKSPDADDKKNPAATPALEIPENINNEPTNPPDSGEPEQEPDSQPVNDPEQEPSPPDSTPKKTARQ